MIQDGLAFWNALKSKIVPLVKTETSNCLRCARYDVTTAPNGSKIGVTLPEGDNEIFIPYSLEVSDATVGDTVMVVWHGSLSNAKAFWFGNGYAGEKTPDDVARKIIFTNQTVATTDWVTNDNLSNNTDFPYKAKITLTGVDATMFPNVVFGDADASSGNFSPICTTVNGSGGGSGGVEIYAHEVPSSQITILSIICFS